MAPWLPAPDLSAPTSKEPPRFAHFARRTVHFDLHEWQQNVLCPLIERLAFERGVRVVFHAPPQYGKSVLLSQRAPAYLLGVDPLHRVGLACYNETHASNFGAVVRDLMLTPEYLELFPDARSRVREDAAMGNFFTAGRKALNDAQPSFMAMGLQSGFTGKGVDTLIIDDPYKSAEEARSVTINDKVWRFWKDTASVRIGEQANVVVMFHRYHEDDLCARLLNEGGWEHIRLPAIADENEDGSDPTGRQPGELLSPMRSVAWLTSQKLDNPGTFEGQFQGRPRGVQGAFFRQEWFRQWEQQGEYFVLHKADGDRRVRVDDCWIVATTDLATSLKATADWFVFAVWAVTPRGELLLLDVTRCRAEEPERLQIVQNGFRRWRPVFIATETNGYQLDFTQKLIREGYPIRPVHVSTDKKNRAMGASARYETEMIFHPAGQRDWLPDWESEILAFPLGKHDDQVDTLSTASAMVSSIANMFPEFGPRHVSPDPVWFRPELPIVCGWDDEPVLSFVALQLGPDGACNVLLALQGQGSESVWDFGRRVLDVLNGTLAAAAECPLEALDVRHHCPPEWLDGTKTTADGMTVADVLLNGQVVTTGYDRHGDASGFRPGFGFVLTPGEPSFTRRVELIKGRLTLSLAQGAPALLVDEEADPVVQALSGGARWQVHATLKRLTGEPEKTPSLATVNALGHALSGLVAATPRRDDEDEHWNQPTGMARGAGRRRVE